MVLVLVLLCGLFLAYANGANDNFKGVATLYGSGTTTYKKALVWATLTTAIGSLTAVFLAKSLIVAFSGKGLLATLLGMLPGTFVYTSLGSAGRHLSFSEPTTWLKIQVWGPFVLVILLSLIPKMIQRRNHK